MAKAVCLGLVLVMSLAVAQGSSHLQCNSKGQRSLKSSAVPVAVVASKPPTVLPACMMQCKQNLLFKGNASTPCLKMIKWDSFKRLATVGFGACKGGMPLDWASCGSKGASMVNMTSKKALKSGARMSNVTTLTIKLDKKTKCFELTLFDSMMSSTTAVSGMTSGAMCASGGSGVCNGIKICISDFPKPVTIKPAPKPSPKPSPKPAIQPKASPAFVPLKVNTPPPAPYANVPDVNHDVYDSNEAYALMQQGYIYLDVRTPEEFYAGHAPGAVNVPLSNTLVQDVWAKFPNYGTPLLVGCLHGSRAGPATDMLRQAGFTKVVYFAGSFMAWQTQNMPIVTY